MAATLPPVNLDFDDVRNRMAQFTVRFDDFIEKSRRRLLEEKNEFARALADDKDREREMKQQIEYLREKAEELSEQTKKEREEAAEAQRYIAEMARKKQSKAEYKAQLLQQIKETEAAIQKKREIRARERTELVSQQSHNAPELAFWEDYLCMRIEGAGAADYLRIIFTHIVESDWEREFSFVLTMTSRDYQVSHCRPRLPEDKLEEVLNRVNESRNLMGFFKDMRNVFAACA